MTQAGGMVLCALLMRNIAVVFAHAGGAPPRRSLRNLSDTGVKPACVAFTLTGSCAFLVHSLPWICIIDEKLKPRKKKKENSRGDELANVLRITT
jgi:hypothetical protein